MRQFHLALFFSSLLLVILIPAKPAHAGIFTVWADSVADKALDRSADLALGLINGYEGALSGKNNYNYFSASAHPINGPNPRANRLKIFMFTNTNNDRDFFNIFGHKDGENGTHSYNADIDIIGSVLNPNIKKGDEGRELTEPIDNMFEGRWNMRRNTDGGVIGGLTGDDWLIRLMVYDSTFNRHVFASDGSSNIRFDRLPYRTYFIAPGDQRIFRANVPEPTTFALIGLGLLGIGLRQGFKRKK